MLFGGGYQRGRETFCSARTKHPPMSQAPKPDKPNTPPAVSVPTEEADDEPDDWYGVLECVHWNNWLTLPPRDKRIIDTGCSGD